MSSPDDGGRVVRTMPAPTFPPQVRICAYCAEPAVYLITITGLDDELMGAAYCCSEPTHWTWLLASAEEVT